jgi:hypothetical protein
MATNVDDKLKRHVATLASDPSQLDSFLHWFTQWLWSALSGLSDPELTLAYRILDMTYLLDDGVWDEAEFLCRMRELAEAERIIPGSLATSIPPPQNHPR